MKSHIIVFFLFISVITLAYFIYYKSVKAFGDINKQVSSVYCDMDYRIGPGSITICPVQSITSTISCEVIIPEPFSLVPFHFVCLTLSN